MPSSPSTAYLLVSHGSRDPRPQVAMERLAQQVRVLLPPQIHSHLLISDRAQPCSNENWSLDAVQYWAATPTVPWVETATLELGEHPLHEQIFQFGKHAQQVGYTQLQVVPLFVLPGVHVMEDIPAEIALAQRRLPSHFQIQQSPYIGSHPGWVNLLAAQQQTWAAEAWILLAHGSRRPGGNQSVERLANDLSAIPAYWAVSPQLPNQVTALAQAGVRRIGILPYFLFAGGITDAIAETVANLANQFPDVALHLAAPLGDRSDELARLVLDLLPRSPQMQLQAS